MVLEDFGGDVACTSDGFPKYAEKDLTLTSGDVIAAAGEGAWAGLRLSGGSYLYLETDTTLRVGVYLLSAGRVWVNAAGVFEIAVGGNEFSTQGAVFSLLRADDGGAARLAVFSGVVTVNGQDVEDGAADISESGAVTPGELTSGDRDSGIPGMSGTLDGWLGGE
jgi:ferric-dicitrate binding protein FerR (iron transport regulator)